MAVKGLKSQESRWFRTQEVEENVCSCVFSSSLCFEHVYPGMNVLFLSGLRIILHSFMPPKGGHGCRICLLACLESQGLSFDSHFLSPVLFRSSSFALSVCHFSAIDPFS